MKRVSFHFCYNSLIHFNKLLILFTSLCLDDIPCVKFPFYECETPNCAGLYCEGCSGQKDGKTVCRHCSDRSDKDKVCATDHISKIIGECCVGDCGKAVCKYCMNHDQKGYRCLDCTVDTLNNTNQTLIEPSQMIFVLLLNS